MPSATPSMLPCHLSASRHAGSTPLGRIVMELRADVVPKTAEVGRRLRVSALTIFGPCSSSLW